jgi:hypothetical protein
MELEFDKEIDAILRKGRDSRGVLVGDDPAEPKKHLDADTIAAFAENALPASARLLYTEHFADCDRCRGQLSQAIVLNREADAAAASTIWPPVEKKTADTPWYSRIFRTPSLALATGSLVLVFAAALGFLVLQRQGENAANNAMMSRSAEPEAGQGSYYTGEPSAANTNAPPAANTAANAPAQTHAEAPSTSTSASNTSSTISSGDTAKLPPAEEKEAEDRKSNNYLLDGVTTSAPKPAAPAGAGAPPPIDQPKAEIDETRAGADDSKDKDLARRDEASRSRMDREAMPEALKKVGPTRAGPLQNQSNQVNNAYGEMSVTRNVGGKTFTNRNGAWYDTAYSGQSPTLLRRGSDEFKKLDSGLRSIAGQLYGTVIVLWKGKAYRIV